MLVVATTIRGWTSTGLNSGAPEFALPPLPIMLECVLYIDDDEALTEPAELVLEAADIEVMTCSAGPYALQRAEAFAPELILLDREMPELDGAATPVKLRKFAALDYVPFVLVPADSDPGVQAALLQARGAHVVAKPLDATNLAGQLHALSAELSE